MHEYKWQYRSKMSVLVKVSRKTRLPKTRHKDNHHILLRISHDNDTLETQTCCQCCWLTCPVWVLDVSQSPLHVFVTYISPSLELPRCGHLNTTLESNLLLGKPICSSELLLTLMCCLAPLYFIDTIFSNYSTSQWKCIQKWHLSGFLFILLFAQ